MKLWIARDKYGSLGIYSDKPIRETGHEETDKGISTWGNFEGLKIGNLNQDEFPEITWENSPQQVELKLCNTDFDKIIEENKDVLKRIKENGD